MKKILANPRCVCCQGTGEVNDFVPWGDTYVSMPSVCECCIEWNYLEGNLSEEEWDANDFELVGEDPRFLEDVDSLPGGHDDY